MSNVRIGFNIFPYRSTRSGGILYYALTMLREFVGKIPDQITLFCGKHSRKLVHCTGHLGSVATRKLREPGEIFDHVDEFDVLFTPAAWGGVTTFDKPTIHVLPDIQEYYYPQFFSSSELKSRHLYHPWVAKSSTILITISDFSRSTMIDKLGVPGNKIRVTPLAAHPIFSDDSEPGVRPSNMPDVRSFLFYPANSWNHKNHIALLDALVEMRRWHGLCVPAVLSGDLLAGEYNHVDIAAEIGKRGLENQVFHIGRPGLRGMKFLYLNATALIHPSLFEGYGIPLVEAMSSGCPIIAAHAASIPEVCGESALYFDPHDHLDIAEKIKQFTDNPDDAVERCRCGKERARRLSDQQTASATLDIIKEAYELAGKKPVEKRIRSRMSTPQAPLLSVLFSAEGNDADRICSALAELHRDLPDLLQLICIDSDGAEHQCDTASWPHCVQVHGAENLHQALKKAAEAAKGRYLCFADSESIPLRSFLFRFADMQLHGETDELLHGESYVHDPRTGCIRERVPIADDDSDALQRERCSSLSFLVRTDKFRHFMNNSREDQDTFRQVALSLWPACQRRRIYLAVNCITFTAFLRDQVDRLAEQLPHRSMVRRWIGTHIGRFVCIQILRLHSLMPSTMRGIIKVGWRALRGS